jgi:hypothetical protein
VKVLIEQVMAWVSETRAILRTCERLAEYFGTDEEEAALRTALAPLLTVVSLIEDPRQWASPSLPELRPTDVACSEDLARTLSPLLRLVCEPVPEFVTTARHVPAAEDGMKLIILFGVFAGRFAINICAPVWRAHPTLAPEGWPLT